jgi:hypothetical protein
MMMPLKKITIAILVMVMILAAVVATAILRVKHYQKAYDSLMPGASKSQVLREWGPPRYSRACRQGATWDGDASAVGPLECFEELWYFSQVTPEQWALGFDREGRAVSKYHFVSP